MARQVDKAKAYLSKRRQAKRAPKKPALVLDIDETAWTTTPASRRKGGIPYDAVIYTGCVIAYDAPAVKPVLSLFKRAKQLKVKVFFITGRPEPIRDGTLENLRAAGYKGKYELILMPAGTRKDSKVPYKSGARKKIQQRGFKIIANVGDQQSDLKGGYSERDIQAAEPDLLHLPYRAPPALALGSPAGGAGARARAHRPGGVRALRPAGRGVGARRRRGPYARAARQGRLPQARAAGPARGWRARAWAASSRARPTSSRCSGSRAGWSSTSRPPTATTRATRCARRSCSRSRASTRRRPTPAGRSTAWAS